MCVCVCVLMCALRKVFACPSQYARFVSWLTVWLTALASAVAGLNIAAPLQANLS